MITQSYRDEFSKKELSFMVLKEQPEDSDWPACPNCQVNTYVKPFIYGYIVEEPIIMPVDGIEIPEELGAPYGAVYEGYDWDCPSCMIIFGEVEGN